LKTFKESDLLFPDKSSYLKFILERDYLRDVYKTESGNPGFENFLADRALMNTFNRAAIMRNNEHSYSDKVMGIIKNFPTLKNQFPILEQISRVPSVSGDNILTLNDRRIITGSQAEIYSQNIKQLANPYIKKVEDPTANKAISDVFSLFSQMMIYQHGVGKSKYGFNIALPSDKYNTIMKYASKVFSTNYMNDKTFNIIFDRLTAVKTPFKSYMIDADKLSSYVQPVLTEETEEELVDNDPSEILMEKPETDIEIEIAALRVREQEELQDAIPNIADYPDTYADVQGNMPDNLYAIYKPIYDKYDLLITSASTQPSTNVKADVILPIGTSGSGKSTFIKSLPQENLLVIEPDAMRVEFTGDINNKSKDAEIYIEAANRAIDGIKNGKQVVFDTTNLTKEKRRPFIEAIKKAIPTVNIQYKLMPLDPELAKQRIKAQIARGENRANVSDETIDRHAASYKQMLEDIKSEDISNYDTQPSTQPTEGIDKFAKKNIFTVTPIQAADKKAKIKASIATQYIGFGEGIVGKDGKRSSTQLYREQVGALANTGNYSSDDVIFVSVPGLRGDTTIAKREQDKTIKEAIKAVEAGATILTDNKAYTDANNYNTGEKRLYANMEAKGYNYSEITVDNEVIGTWSKSTQPIAVEETETNLPPAGAQLDMFDNFDASSEELRKQQEEDERKEDEEDNNCTDSPFLD
jgi:predicted kinase